MYFSFNFFHILNLRQFLSAVGLLCLLNLAACSGSLSSESETSEDVELKVAIGSTGKLGQNIRIPVGTEQIDIVSSVRGEDDTYTYIWSAQPALFQEELSDTTTETVQLSIPESVITDTNITLTLIVIDSDGKQASTSMLVEVFAPNTNPEIISFEIDDKDQVVHSGKGFSFQSEWIDAQDGQNVASAIIYVTPNAAVDGIPSNGVLTQFDTAEVSFPALYIVGENQFINKSDKTASLTFTLSVTDMNGKTVTSSPLFIDILPASLTSLTIDAGDAQTVYTGQLVNLIGEVSRSDNIEYAWLQSDSETRLDLDVTDSLALQFNAPSVDSKTLFELKFTATDVVSGISYNDFVSVTVLPIGIFDGMNDTGITNCANETSNLVNCGQTNLPRQDAEIGRDSAALNAELAKEGGGELGFDFTLLNQNGEEDFTSTPTCVRDNVTGLIWEIKTTSGIRAHTHTFSWFDESEFNGGFSGSQTSNSAACFTDTSLTACSTASYIEYINSVGMCGGNDWRLPTVNELVSILNYANDDDKLALGANNFQIWSNHAKASTPYWTSESSLFGVNDSESPETPNAWAVNLSTGDEHAHSKLLAGAILLVR
ncbi:hypothetical protein XM47_07045 [Catenovulum maritimum]|uniref:Cadherin domain-containing protein n=1 Tax=Catenovulum maritimum TaxID=1513271 RepID=A0A0J8JMC5_9ALTE|nr:hypothetical protein XM47_07045 [Catenovulum maritimum]